MTNEAPISPAPAPRQAQAARWRGCAAVGSGTTGNGAAAGSGGAAAAGGTVASASRATSSADTKRCTTDLLGRQLGGEAGQAGLVTAGRLLLDDAFRGGAIEDRDGLAIGRVAFAASARRAHGLERAAQVGFG